MVGKDYLTEIQLENDRQEAKWGVQNWPDWTPTGPTSDLSTVWPGNTARHFKWIVNAKSKGFEGLRLSYFDILMEEVAEAHDEAKAGNITALREELIQVAAVAKAWLEKLDRDEEKGVG